VWGDSVGAGIVSHLFRELFKDDAEAANNSGSDNSIREVCLSGIPVVQMSSRKASVDERTKSL